MIRDHKPFDNTQAPWSDDEMVRARVMLAYFESGRSLVRVVWWLFIALGALVALVGGIINIMHQTGASH